MTMARVRFVVAALLFVGWIGFLAYLVVRTRSTPILAQPQFRVAPLVVIAEVKDADGAPATTVMIEQIVWSSAPQRDARLAHTDVEVTYQPGTDPVKGYAGPGRYILPLLRPAPERGVRTYRLVPGPIYRATPEAEAELDALLQSRGR